MSNETDEKVIDVEAETLEEARDIIKSQVPEDLAILSEQVEDDGKAHTVQASADTEEAAFALAQKKIADGKDIVDKKVINSPELRKINVEAFDEGVAKGQVEAQKIAASFTIKSVKLTREGSKGILGLGKKPNEYEFEVLIPAAVEITYRGKARVIAKVGKKKTDAGVSQVFIDAVKKGAKDHVAKMDTSKYLGTGAFESVAELEAATFIALLSDMTGGMTKDEVILALVVEHYGLDESKVRAILRDFKASRR